MSDLPQVDVLQKLGRAYRGLLGAFGQVVGIPLPRWRILLALSGGDPISQKKLARDLVMDPAALTRQIQAVERKGLVVRETDPADQRIVHVMLTPAGHEVVSQALPIRTALVMEVVQGLDSAQQQALEGMLDSLLAELERIRRDAPAAPSTE